MGLTAPDVNAMAPEARLVEIATIIARGYRRMLLTKSDGTAELSDEEHIQLAYLDPVEPSCSNAVNSRENEEVA